MELLTILNKQRNYILRFISSTFAIVVDRYTNEYFNVYTDELGIELLKNTLVPHPKYEV